MSNIYDLADTWNNAGVAFTAIKMNVTDTASLAASLLMDLQVGGASKFKVTKTGAILADTPNSAATFVSHSSGWGMGYFDSGITLGTSSVPVAYINAAKFQMSALIPLTWTSSGWSGTEDLVIRRDDVGVLAQRNGTNAQTNRLYGTYTDASNYRRVSLAMTTAGVATLKPEGAGTGASGNVLHISGLPTSNPGAGILWNNSGTPAIGT